LWRVLINAHGRIIHPDLYSEKIKFILLLYYIIIIMLQK
jgi:hypothetical protein